MQQKFLDKGLDWSLLKPEGEDSDANEEEREEEGKEQEEVAGELFADDLEAQAMQMCHLESQVEDAEKIQGNEEVQKDVGSD